MHIAQTARICEDGCNCVAQAETRMPELANMRMDEHLSESNRNATSERKWSEQ